MFEQLMIILICKEEVDNLDMKYYNKQFNQEW